jgi:hypothetical protein
MKTNVLLVFVLMLVLVGAIAAFAPAGQPEKPSSQMPDSLPAMVAVSDENGLPVMCGDKLLRVPRELLVGPPPPRPFVPVGPGGPGAIAQRGQLTFRCGPKGEPVVVPAE